MKYNMIIRLAVLAFIIAALVSGAGFATSGTTTPFLDGPAWERGELSTGVELFKGDFEELFGAPQTVRILRVNLNEPTVKVRFAASDLNARRRAPVPDFVEATGAIAAINGGFFFGGGTGGLESTNRGIFMIDGEVRPFTPRETEELYFVGGAAVGIDADENWHFRNRPGDCWPPNWPEVEHALAGGHRLIERGEVHPSITRYATAREKRHAAGRHPRTAIGLLPDRLALLITVDGRHSGNAEGMTLEELANFMKDLGCTEALNLDGGGSTTFWLRGDGVINHPSDNRRFDHEGARPVFSAVVIMTDKASPQ